LPRAENGAKEKLMDRQLQDLAADLAAARALAEEGRRGPLRGGGVLVVFGVAVSACLVFNWAVASGALDITPWSIPAVWFGGMTSASLISSHMRRRLVGSGGGLNFGNAVTSSVWRAAGIFFAVYSIALFTATLLTPTPMFSNIPGLRVAAAFSSFTPVTFGVYAIALAASATAASSSLLGRFSWLSMAFMAATAALIGRPEQLLVAAVGALAVLAAPGAMLMRLEKQAS
jgi:hypothetical protein